MRSGDSGAAVRRALPPRGSAGAALAHAGAALLVAMIAAPADARADEGGPAAGAGRLACDGQTDDTAALRNAIAFACIPAALPEDWGLGEGAPVSVPRGMCRVTDTISVTCDALTISGAGVGTTVLWCDLGDSTKDCVVVGNEKGDGRRVAIENLTVAAPKIGAMRDAIRTENVSWLRIENVATLRAGRHGLNIGGGLDTILRNVRPWHGGGAGLRLGNSGSGVEATTITADAVYSAYNNGPGVLVEEAHSVSFDRLIAEFNGRLDDPKDGQGVRIVGGAGRPAGVTLVQPYLQSNSGWDLHVGAHPRESAYVTVINPWIVVGTARPGERTRTRKQRGYGGVLIDRAIGGALVGGTLNFLAGVPALRFTASAKGFAVIGTPFLAENPPQFDPEHGRTIADYSGLVLAYDGVANNLVSALGLRIGGGGLIRRHLSETTVWDASDGKQLQPGALARTRLKVQGAARGDTVVCALSSNTQSGVPVYGTVDTPDSVMVTLENRTGVPLSIGAGTVRCDVWRH